MIAECYLLDEPEYREGFVHRVLRCTPDWVERLERDGWTDWGAGSRIGYRVIRSGGCLYEARLVNREAGVMERIR